jgi:hypothetical protein
LSLKYSDSVPADELGGVAARTLSAELAAMAAAGERSAVVAPLFLGPSGALASGVTAAAAEHGVELRLAECLVAEAAPDDSRVGDALADGVLHLAEERGLRFPLKVCPPRPMSTPLWVARPVRPRLWSNSQAFTGPLVTVLIEL